MKRVILHIDFDSFFASCEQQFNPLLRHKPVGVVATNGRTCIIAASREAKKMGVKSPTRTWEVKDICPNLITVPAQFEKYWEITQKFLDICKDYTPYVELFSLDETFMDITSTENLFGGRYQIVETIKKRIREEIGEYITVSVGLSHNRLLAKLGSGMNKPDGFMKITLENLEEVYSRVKLTDFCGIGSRIERRLNRIGINTPLQLRAASLDVLISEFKDHGGHFLKNLGLGEDESEVLPYYQAGDVKSVGRNYCIPQNCYDQRLILQHVFELSEEIGIKLRKINKKARTVGFYLSGGSTYHGRKTVTDYIDKGTEIFSLCKTLYEEWGFPKLSREEGMVRQISVWAASLEDADNLTISIFEDRKDAKVQNVMDKINEKFGDHTIRNGFVHLGPNLKTVPNGFMADKYERQKLAESFKKYL